MAPTSDERRVVEARLRTAAKTESGRTSILYDADGDVVGIWCAETGRAMLGDSFYARLVERPREPLDALRGHDWGGEP